MSRTIRRKQFINTNYKGRRYFDRWHFTEWNGDERVVIHKEDDLNKWQKAFYKCHSESDHPKLRGSNKEIRKYREGQFRSQVKAELQNVKKDTGYDPVISEHGERNWWDWS